MAQKRMFDKGLLETDAFMDMPMPTKALYFLLGMEADDEGFVSPKRVMRLYGGNDDDIKVLLSKGFIISFKSGVVVITDWNKNNWLDNRRIKETIYQAEKKLLTTTKGNKYALLSKRLADDEQMLSQYSIEESSIEESSIEESRVEELATKVADPIFSFSEELEKMKSNKINSLIPIIGWYWEMKGIFPPTTREQFNAVLRRDLRAASVLKNYPLEIIKQKMFDLNGLVWMDWTLETILKYIDKPVPEK